MLLGLHLRVSSAWSGTPVIVIKSEWLKYGEVLDLFKQWTSPSLSLTALFPSLLLPATCPAPCILTFAECLCEAAEVINPAEKEPSKKRDNFLLQSSLSSHMRGNGWEDGQGKRSRQQSSSVACNFTLTSSTRIRKLECHFQFPSQSSEDLEAVSTAWKAEAWVKFLSIFFNEYFILCHYRNSILLPPFYKVWPGCYFKNQYV